MTVLSCPIPGCGFQTADVDVIGAAAILNVHSHVHASPALSASSAPLKGPKLERPKLRMNATTEDWNAFVRRWDTFCAGSCITAAAAPGQLLECTSEQLGNIVLRADPSFTSHSLDDALKVLKSLAVVPVALGVLRSQLAALRQNPDEPFRTFAASVQGKAETCEFRTRYSGICANCKSSYSGDVYYTDEVIRDVLLNGIDDLDIRREALSTDGIQSKSVTDVIAFVESRETARNANPPSSVAAVSSYRRSSASAPTSAPTKTRYGSMKSAPPSAADRGRTAPCPDCKKGFNLFSQNARGHWNKKAHERCKDCWYLKRNRSSPSSQQIAESSAIVSEQSDAISQISGVELSSAPSSYTACDSLGNGVRKPYRSEVVSLTHHIFTKGEWRRARMSNHPLVELQIGFDKKRTRLADVSAVADTGAQSDVWSLEEYLAAGFTKEQLSPVSISLHAANRSPIRIEGAFFAKIIGRAPDGSSVSCRTMTYVSPDAKSLYLSYDTMLQLGIVDVNFPTVGVHQRSSAAISNPGSICGATSEDHNVCECPKRTDAPERPARLPFPCIPENNEKMKEWLLHRFRSSSFNTCPHQLLPCMSGPPVEIHLQEDAKPKACHTAAPIPVHWQDKVFQDLLRDEALGVVERVPYGEPVTWCHRMVVTRKANGTPRRTVDLSPLNKFCKRETHNSESPFHLARRVPPNNWKTVTDAWNGYHSVPLRESDRHLTTFITPFGRWRYARAPQGFLSSGDGYNRRFDAILADFQRKERIVDDTIIYDEDLETHWWRTIDFLITVGKAGVVLNPDKFQFAQKEADFAGFRITSKTIDPLPKYYNAIRDFPTPVSTTDVRSWFGLVNQVANYAQLREHMAPFRPFLSPKHPFEWNADLDKVFETSKDAILKAIAEGVEIFDVKRPTCLRPDWSSRGIGYFLMQKHCACSSETPDCCVGGWRIALAGSRFLTSAEQRYAPVEGEALAVAWSLEQTKFFTLGCDNLIVATDHKPLVKLFGDRTLDEISNTRLFRLKQRTLPWFFRVIHVPGRLNVAADAASRYPSHDGNVCGLTLGDLAECAIDAAIRHDAETITSVTWSRLQEATKNDPDFRDLLDTLRRGFPAEDRHKPFAAPFWRFRHGLYESDGVILYDNRAVVPNSLRRAVVDALHAAHQGTSTMETRARSIVFWPGMTEDIHKKRASCYDCVKNAPSQAALPSNSSPPPATPFEEVFADFFDCGGCHYLVIGDRLSGWTDVFQCTPGSPRAGAEGLISCLRNYFSRFGVPAELSSDGGPEFVAGVTQDFLSRWGVQHRLSSAYHPQSNGRAEVAVKTAKRLLRSNTSPSGTLDSDRFLRAMLQLRNTPDPDCNISPAQIVFGRPIRDAFAFVSRLNRFTNCNIRPEWREAWRQKEVALRNRFHRTAETLNEHAHPLTPLRVGDRCYVQNQTGNNPRRWDRSGTVTDVHDFDSYSVKIDGTGRVTRRNRRFLRRFVPASPNISFPESSRSISTPQVTVPSSSTEQESSLAPARPSQEPVTPHTSQEPVATVTRLQSSTNSSETTNSAPSSPMQPSKLRSPMATGLHPVDFTPAVAPNIPPLEVSQPVLHRPRRGSRPPLRYEPETGRWV